MKIWKKALFGVGLFVAGVCAQAEAGPMAPPVISGPKAPIHSQPLPGGCLTPSLPGSIVTPPSTLPGTLPPSMPGLGTTPTPSFPPTGAGQAAAEAALTPSAIGGGGGESGGDSLASAAPGMIGDLGVRGLYREADLNGGFTSPIANQAAFRIVENESPVPVTRAFTTFNYFNNVGTSGDNSYDLYRATVGFEYAFLNNNASVGLRVPVQFRDQGEGQSVDGFADLTLITKFVFLKDCASGSLVSGGLAVTAPMTREARLEESGDLRNWLFQPWVGFLFNADRFYVQGFSSYAIASESRDVGLLANDIGIGYKLYHNPHGTLTAIIPTLEAHLLTPLRNRGVSPVNDGTRQVGAPDMLTLTGGVHLGIGERAYLTLGFGAPITGNKLFDYEGVIQFNVGF